MTRKKSIAVTIAINPHKHPEIYRRIEAMNSRARPSHLLFLLAQKSSAVAVELLGGDHHAVSNSVQAASAGAVDPIRLAQSNTSSATKPTAATIDPSMLVGVFGPTSD
jgi:hypothetical protein